MGIVSRLPWLSSVKSEPSLKLCVLTVDWEAPSSCQVKNCVEEFWSLGLSEIDHGWVDWWTELGQEVDHLGLPLQDEEHEGCLCWSRVFEAWLLTHHSTGRKQECVPGSLVYGSLVLDNNQSSAWRAKQPAEHFQLNYFFRNLMWICSWCPQN